MTERKRKTERNDKHTNKLELMSAFNTGASNLKWACYLASLYALQGEALQVIRPSTICINQSLTIKKSELSVTLNSDCHLINWQSVYVCHTEFLQLAALVCYTDILKANTILQSCEGRTYKDFHELRCSFSHQPKIVFFLQEIRYSFFITSKLRHKLSQSNKLQRSTGLRQGCSFTTFLWLPHVIGLYKSSYCRNSYCIGLTL